ncbi:MAG: DUF3572 domain-containing protein [Albidovulum sp.]|nr:DUF3572 domain-containing protein [Albidovulum sp.]
MTPEYAEIVAIKAVAWLAGADERILNRFFAITGATSDDFQRVAKDNEFGSTVLEFILGHEKTVIEFCEYSDLPLDAPLLARQALPGGNLPHWT